MFKWVKAIFAVSLTVLLSACATAPPTPKISIAPGARIGILVDTADEPTHTHIGTTVFNNFTKQYKYDWRLSSEMAGRIERIVRAAGYTPVNLKSAGLSRANIADLIVPVDSNWQVAPDKQATFKRLKDELGLQAVIALSDGPVAVWEEVGGSRYVSEAGLFTRGVFGFTHYKAAAAFQWSVYALNPAANIGYSGPFSYTRSLVTDLSSFQNPADFGNITNAELAPVRDAILFMVSNKTYAALDLLSSK